MFRGKFPFYQQSSSNECGPACLRMVSKFHGVDIPVARLRELYVTNKEGINLLGISEAAERLHLRTIGAKVQVDQLAELPLPCILHWKQDHFVVLHKVKNDKYHIADPDKGLITLDRRSFTQQWLSHRDASLGIVLLLSPTPQFHEQRYGAENKVSWRLVTSYFLEYKQLLAQLGLGLGIGSLLSAITPFLTQAIVDVGINSKNIGVVGLILIAQLVLFVSSTGVSFIRSWILLHISTRVNIAILTDFLAKLMRLPISFFEQKSTGDIMQRMTDQQRIESFITGNALSTLFSMVNLVIFTLVLFYYDRTIFFVSLSSTVIYAIWISFFLEKRRQLNYKQFNNSAANQNNIVEIIGGMQEIKLNNCERVKRWQWEEVQAELFKFKVQALSLRQLQQAGTLFINQAKNILITYLSVSAVINGDITLGGMMAIQYIVGQVSSPVEQILDFVQSYQDAKISLERLNEIHLMADEEPGDRSRISKLPDINSIVIRDLSFQYPGAGNEPVLKNIDLDIPMGKTTAIVGMSGSGKTTLLKLLLRYYPAGDSIKVGGSKLEDISFKTWRDACGTVMQDGFIFSDTIENNITVSKEHRNVSKLEKAIKTANLVDLIDDLPFGTQTKIGSTGNGLSQGQKQRLLIARAVYKDPEYLFFDEATNALDANNERVIMDNLAGFFNNRTVVVVAHRLSTVKNAHNIVVLNKGEIIEQGTHEHLVRLRGAYFELVKNQLELDV